MFTTNIYEIPLKPENQTFRINLNGIDYTFTLRWNSRAEHWILNIGDTFDRPLINGIPLVIGVNLLAGHKCFAIGGIGTNLFIRSVAETYTSPNNLPRDPNFDDLGTKTRLYFGINVPDNQLFIPGQNDFRPLPLPPGTVTFTRFILFDESCHLFVSEDFGITWAQYDSPPGTMHHAWDHLAMAINDDDYITIAGQDSGRSVTISTVEEFPHTTLHNVVDMGIGLAITDIGQTIIVGGSPPYISRDKGINWTAFSPDGIDPRLSYWSAVAFSQNASIAYMWGDYDGKVWISSDNLNSWTELLSSDIYELIGHSRLRCSKDGHIVAVGDVDIGDFYISIDIGTTWSYTNFQNLVDPGYDKSINYFDFGMSTDGSLLLAIVSGYDDIARTDFGMAWTSSDHGVTWVDRNLPIINDSSINFPNPDAIVCNVSPDGKYLLVGYSGNNNGQAAISIDGGATWISCDFPMDNSQSGAGFWIDSYVVTGVPALIQQAYAQGFGDAQAFAPYGRATQLSGTNIYRLGVPTALDMPTTHAVVDSGLGLLSVWLVYYSAINGNPGDLLNIQPVNTTSGPVTLISISPYNRQMTIQLEGIIGGSNAIFTATTSGNFDLSDWRHICISWDTNHPAGQKILQVYVNGVQQSFLSINDTSGPFLVNYSTSILEYSFFESHFYNGQGYGEIYDFWFAPGQFLDLSVPGNLERFRADIGAAPGLGANGEFPTGIPPSFFFHKDNYELNDPYVFPVNRGTGGVVSYSVAAFSISETAPVDVVGTPLPPRGTAAGHATVIGIAPPTPPILLCHFDGTSGSTTFTDTAGGHTLTPTGATINTSAPKFGTGAGSFTTSSGRIVLNNPASFNIGTNPFTIDAWIRFTSAPSNGIYGVLTQFGGSSNLGWFLGQVNGQAAFYYSTNGFDNPNIGAAFTPTLNTWYHLAVDRDMSNIIRVYLNGAIIASATVTSAIFSSTQACVIGNDNNNVRAFPGYIDELRMVLRQAMYGGAFTPPTAPYTP